MSLESVKKAARENPPAFPCMGIATDYDAKNDTSDTYSYNEQEGMLLRDYFAAKAMQSMQEQRMTVSDAAAEIGIEPKEYNNKIHWPLVVAANAYKYADAMLEARKEKS